MDKSQFNVVLLPGDGIGPDVVNAAVKVMDAAAADQGITLNYQTFDAGAAYYQRTGKSIDDAGVEAVGESDAVLLGAMGLPSVRKADGTEIAPQIDLREHYDLYASLRPCLLLPGVKTRLDVKHINMLVIRELTEGLFAGRHDPIPESDESCSDRLTITRAGAERLCVIAFEQARLRKAKQGTPGHVTLLDKANVLRSNAFLRKLFDEVAARYPDIGSDRQYIDAGSMMFITDPERYDVVVTENVFGDITSEIAAGVVGGLGVAPSGDVNDKLGIFQPSHGSAPDIAGKGLANPVATILSGAMLLDWIAEKQNAPAAAKAAAAIRAATGKVLASGPKTRDIGGTASTDEVTDAIVSALNNATVTA
ncbi:isocitrate/isopropylmalate dehydrogenase family protein [Paracoccus marinaquae]|uniref:Isocitrate/isopropylmalate dehydrogenase family protein n=1 Tax=Paracoccus marinaquae TaxID=2841926 RepID=A0ABS6AQD8_9RHOB|nr:isocitrate/isopropylmalate family dehydrogenase [Paracoccus marinaquae]MBU3032337.1 isocitrate/isopropylmalate dehydrogenase family protein [Paracoccus marinaquae]